VTLIDQGYVMRRGDEDGACLAYARLPRPRQGELGGGMPQSHYAPGKSRGCQGGQREIGTEHRSCSPGSRHVGTSVTDTVRDSYTSTVPLLTRFDVRLEPAKPGGGAGEAATDRRVRPSGSPPGPQQDSAIGGTSDNESITDGITLSTAVGGEHVEASGANSSIARTTQRYREFPLEQHEPTATSAERGDVKLLHSRGGRRVVLGDAQTTGHLGAADDHLQPWRRCGMPRRWPRARCWPERRRRGAAGRRRRWWAQGRQWRPGWFWSQRRRCGW